MEKSPKLSSEVQERALRMVLDAKDQYPYQWAVTQLIAGKIGCAECRRPYACWRARLTSQVAPPGLRRGITRTRCGALNSAAATAVLRASRRR